jgi:serpin B
MTPPDGTSRRAGDSWHSWFLIAGLLALAGACKKETGTGGEDVPPLPAPPPPAPTVPLARDEGVAVGISVGAFTADLFPLLSTASPNFAFSPTSIVAALAMTSRGARGETAAQMAQVLHLGDDPDGMRTLLGRALRLLPGTGVAGWPELAVANRLFAERGYDFHREFFDWVAAEYGAPLEALDFRNSPEPARERINTWVAEQTRQRIPEILPANSIVTTTRLVLVNALYFKGGWGTPFEDAATRPGAFTLQDGTSVEVPTMETTDWFGYGAMDGARLLKLPYADGEFLMVFVLPPEGSPPEDWATAANLRYLWTEDARVHVRLPRFRIEDPEPRALKDDLTALGMPSAFDPAKADFDGIASPPDPANRLFIGNVFHRASVLVDEQGTEAAAATAVAERMMGNPGPPPPPEVFFADRPFLFFRVQRDPGLILFAGRVGDPRIGAPAS